MNDDWGITPDGKNRWKVRVRRLEARTGLPAERKATVGGSKRDARAARDRLCAELASTAASRPRTRLSVFADAWSERNAGRLKRTTRRRYGFALAHILPALGDVYIDALTPADVTAYVSARTASGAAGYTVLNELRVLRTIAKDTIAEGYAPRDWCHRVAAPDVSQYSIDNPNLLSGEQFAAVFAKLPARWRGFVLLMVTTGLRWGEASALRWDDIVDMELIVRRANDRGREVEPKNKGSYRAVPLLPEVLAAIGERKPGALLCPHRLGRLHINYPLLDVLEAACTAAKVPRVKVHGLRRTFVNEARKHAARDVVKAITGHATDRMVEHYSVIGAGEKRAASRAVAGSIGLVRDGDAK